MIRRLLLIGSIATLASALALAGAVGSLTLAHGPNPLLGTKLYDQDQIIGYQWAPGAVPPGWAAAAIDAGAADVGESRNSRAATFTRVSSADSRIAYGGPVPCSSYGIACMNRTGVPNSFAGMWFRPHGWLFDWGALKWCQSLQVWVNGCYDVENVALDEFGHIEILGHHVNFADDSDFLDSVVQFAARSRPKAGWNEHVFGRCDVARLQLEYELISASDKVSTCLSLATSLSIAPTSAAISAGDAVRITGNLKVAVGAAAEALSGDPLSSRIVTLQRRALGSSTWSHLGTLSASSAAGAYTLTITPNVTFDYRLLFTTPTTEGLTASTSATIRITVSQCSGMAMKTIAWAFMPCE